MCKFRRIGFLSLAILGLVALGCSSDVKVGVVLSETGTMASYGQKVKNGIDLAADEINADGGIRGGQVQLIYRDDQTNKERAKQVTTELIDQEGVRVIIGGVSSPMTLAIAPICESKRTILISPSSSAPEISQAGDYIYRNYPSDILEGMAMAKFARDLGLERIALFALNNEWGSGLQPVFTQEYESKYREVIKAYTFDDGQTAEFPGWVDEVKELDPDGIYIAAYVNEMAELLRQIDAAGVDTVIMGSGALINDLIRRAGEAAEHLIYPQPTGFDVDSPEPAVRAFVDSYRAKYKEDPDVFAAHGYDALKLIALAMENADGSHPDDVRIGFSSIKDYNGAAGLTDFDENGDVVRYPRLFIIRDGVAVPYQTFRDEGGTLATGN
jgi:branched-chain amino acid transport system substrate-binding protein